MHLQSAPTIDHVTLIRGYPSHLAYNCLLLFIIWKQGWLWKFVFKILSIKKDDNSELYKHISSQTIHSYGTSFICFQFHDTLCLHSIKGSISPMPSNCKSSRTTRVLANTALRGQNDWLKGLDENVILATPFLRGYAVKIFFFIKIIQQSLKLPQGGPYINFRGPKVSSATGRGKMERIQLPNRW